MFLQRLLIAGGVLGFTMGALWLAQRDRNVTTANKMAEAAQEFLASLTPEQRKAASFDFDDKERLNWHYIPRERKGVPLRDLEGKPRQAFLKLVKTGLSKKGDEQAEKVRSLEEVLFILETTGTRDSRRERRHPGKYYISIFGKPSNSGKWGWRLEGHHLSLNYTIENGKVISSTPEFFGSNPSLIDAGPKRSIRVMAEEEDLARQIIKLCDKDQEKLAWRSPKAPDDIRSRGTKQPETTPPVGLPASKMSAAQKKLLGRLLTEYLQNMPKSIETKRRAEIEKAGIDKIHFAWWGSKEKNKRHAYRIQGPTFVVEYNNTQNDANHLHTIFRDLHGDFGIPLKN